MNYHPLGDRALLINLDQKIDLEINAKVLSIKRLIENSALDGIEDLVPGYCSLTVHYNPAITEYSELVESIIHIASGEDNETSKNGRTLRIPVCYDESMAPDIAHLSEMLNLSQQSIQDLHTTNTYHVYMMGFLPGFAYMGSLVPELYCKRKEVPRLAVPSGSVGLAGYQTGIYPVEAPGGWQLIGRTPIPLVFSDQEEAFLFKAGDEINFYPIPENEFHQIEGQVKNSDFNYNKLYE